jgi:outer membrane biosynthesis protein TonB
MANFAGAITAMALIWAGTKLFKTPRHVAQPPQPQTPEQKNLKEQETKKEKEPKKRKQQQPQPQPQPKEQQIPPQPPQPEHPTPSIPGCTHKLSYLQQPGKTKEIPDECLTCTQLIQCLTAANK